MMLRANFDVSYADLFGNDKIQFIRIDTSIKPEARYLNQKSVTLPL